MPAAPAADPASTPTSAAPADPIAVVDRYLANVADLDADPAALAARGARGAGGGAPPTRGAPPAPRRDAATTLAARAHVRTLLAGHRFDVRGHIVAGDRVVTRLTWTGTLAIDAGAWPAGTEMRAECCMVFTVRDGRILRQETYDCYHPVEVPAAAPRAQTSRS